MKKIFILILMLGLTSALFSQYTNITISNTNNPNEPSICINPKNLNQVVAGANTNQAYYSTNSGLTWTRFVLTSTSWGVFGDPCIIVDTLGAFYYFHLSNNLSLPWPPIDRIVCQKSTNGGMSYNNPGSFTFFNLPKLQDKEWAVVDPRNNHIYVTWTQFDTYGTSNQSDSSNILFSKSTDGGLTWVNFGNGTAKRINQLGGDCVDEDNTVEGAVPAVGPNGEIYVAWAGPKIRNSQFGIFFDKSTDGGTTWLQNDTYVADQKGGWDYMISGIQRANGLPVTCCDISNGPNRGNIYINWTDSAGPNNHDVKFVRSTNGGLNWSAPLKVNTDNTNKEQFFCWMTVDQMTGVIYICFYDRRDDVSNAGATHFYMAKSTNGGVSFTDEKISETSFIPTSSVFFGDYTNITAYNGVVRPIWIRLQGTALSVLTAIIGTPTGVTEPVTETPKEYKLEQNFPNPFNPTTTITYSVPKSSLVTLKVYDMLGREVSNLVNEYKSAGIYNFDFDGREFSSGIYFYKLTAGEFSSTKKMMLSK
jgi:hypothetical protein